MQAADDDKHIQKKRDSRQGRADMMYMQMSSNMQVLREWHHHTRSVKHIKEGGGKIVHLVPD